MPLRSARIARKAQKIAEGSRRLLQRVSVVHQKSDEVHHAMEDLHGAVRALHEPASGGTSEATELVTDEKVRKSSKPFIIVGIGASAGGYEAFADFLTKLPDETGMAFVLVQHLDPNHRSKLTELLSHSTKLPIIQAGHDMPVEPDHIYVIPENATMTISGGKLKLAKRDEHELPPMPIDAFFRSLAHEQQNRAIGVVLSGTGTDGTLGVEAIKGEGGITFAQDEKSSKYFGMPRSALASGSVDFVMSPSALAGELGRVARHPYLRPDGKAEVKPLERSDLDKLLHDGPGPLSTLFGLLRARTGVDFTLYKQSTLKRRILRRMVLHKLDSLGAYVRLLQGNSAEVEALFNDLLINVTSFFRDPATFQVLKRKIFPRMLKLHSDDSPLRLWVCGCATGEEAYSLAMSVVEYFEQAQTHRQVQVFATDISDMGIERARTGLYPENIVQDVSPERLRRFFTRVDGKFQIHKSIRDMCVFARQNVLVDPPFSNLDLITCRNVLIYFGPILQRKIIPLFHYALRPDGFLVLGGSESIGPSTEHFVLADKRHKIYTKKTGFLRAGFELSRPQSKGLREVRRDPEDLSQRVPKTGDLHQQVDKIILREFSPAAVVVNSDFEVVQFRGRTGDYLEHSPGMATLSLLKMARESLVMHLRSTLGKAAKQDMPFKTSGVELKNKHQSREISIEVVPFRLAPGDEQFFFVAFKEAEPGWLLKASEGKTSPSIRKLREHHQLEKLKHELETTRESLQAIIEEQEATNEELKSANEEIQSSNEELQSTNEELETAKEELQSTNEELTTLNEELQNRNAELSQVNNDLTNLLGSVNVAILMLGGDLTLRRYTPMAERIFNLIPSDLGRPLTDVSRRLLALDLDPMAREVIDNLTIIERETQDRDGHSYLLRIRPYRTRENRIEGAVIMLLDIDAQRRAMEGILGTISIPTILLGNDLKIRSANQPFLDMFKLEPGRISNLSIEDIAGAHWQTSEFHGFIEEVQKSKQVMNLEIDATLPGVGGRKLRLTARRFAEDNGGLEMVILAIEDVTEK